MHKFGLSEADDETAYIKVNCLEDLLKLNKELNNFCREQDDWRVYFGIMIKYDDKGVPILEIKDSYN